MSTIISVKKVSKYYSDKFQALNNVNLNIQKGEIFALLGQNGAGKTSLINIVCGIINSSSGKVIVDNYDASTDFRKTRSMIGLVPQELFTNSFESVWNTVCFSRGLFGKRSNSIYIEKVLRDLSLWDKKNTRIQALSGGMKRRVMIAKALAHEPSILFLDEPTAGVDVELRKGMWEMVRGLRDNGVTIVLTTHYIEEAQEMADRVGVIRKGEILLVENKKSLMSRLGNRRLILTLKNKIQKLPESLVNFSLNLINDGKTLIYTYNENNNTNITCLFNAIFQAQIEFVDIRSSENSLEEIFVNLVSN